ncbi:MAG: TIM-barrel domain-containing protein, partial [Phycisphaerae bacterium]
GHMPGPVDPEVYVRWLQFGALSPLMRTHATSSPQAERRIWAFDEQYFEAGRGAYRLRQELLPYIAAAARACYETGMPLCRPLYYEWPDEPRAYETPGEYLFGPDLLVVPVVAPGNPTSGAARVRVWLPPGCWIDWFTGERRTGPVEFTTLAPLDRVLLYARDSAVIPTARPQRTAAATLSGEWILNIFPAARGGITLTHDDGVSNAYRTHAGARTEVRSEHDAASGRVAVSITATGRGAIDGAGGQRGAAAGGGTPAGYEVRVRSESPPSAVRRDGVALRRGWERGVADWHFDAETFATVVSLGSVDESSSVIELVFDARADATDALDRGLLAALQLLERAERVFGDRTPADVRGILARWHGGVADRDAAAALAHDVVDRWDEHVRSLLAIRDAPTAADGVLMLMLGLDYDVTIGGVNDDARSATLAVRLRRAPPLGAPAPILGRIEIEPPQYHSLDRTGVVVGDVPVGDAGFGVTRALTWEGPVRTDRARVRISFEVGERTIPAIVEPVLFPSINVWWVIGPFDCPFAESLERVLPPEGEIDLAATYEGKGGARIAWRRVERPLVAGAAVTDEFAIDLNRVCGASDNAVAYALTYLHTPDRREAVLALGSDDGVQVWLNGVEIHRKRLVRPYGARQDFVPLALRAGSNTLLLKISQGAGGWGFGAHVEDANGAPLLGVEPRLAP